MALADNVDGGDDLDLIVTTMNGNVFCFSTPSPHHPLKVRLLILLKKLFVTWFGPLYVCLGSKKLKLKPELGGDVMFLGRSGVDYYKLKYIFQFGTE